MNDNIRRAALKEAQSASSKIEELRSKRTATLIKHAKEIGEIDQDLNVLYAKLSTALSMATDS